MSVKSSAVAATLTATIAFAPSAGAEVLFIPGTGSSKPTAANATTLGWLDDGRYGSGPAYCMCNSHDYPARLGPGEGQESIDRGTESTVQFLLAHPDVDEVVGGSQGAMVAYQAVADPRLAGRHLSVRLYADPYTPGTGAVSRVPNGWDVPATGLKGGVPQQPGPDVTVTSVSHKWDPVAYFPRYQWTYAWTLPTAALGFIVYHGALGGPYGAMGIDYTNATVTHNGNETLIRINDKLTPYGQLAVIVATAVGGPQAGRVVGTLIKPLDDIADGFLSMGGQWDKGVATPVPTPQVAVKQVQGVVNGFVRAAQDFAAIPQRLNQPVKKPTPVAAITPAKKPKKPQSNPVNDTTKTVRGAINNTIKTWAPKPKPQKKSGAVK